MERWAANTLRTLGIILTAGFVLVTSFLLALISLCAAQGGFGGVRHPEQVLPYALGAVAVVVVGVFVIAMLARGIVSSGPVLATAGAAGMPVPEAAPLHLSPTGKQAIHRLVYALSAQIGASAIIWFLNQARYWTNPRGMAPHSWILMLLAPFILYHIPYALLIYALLNWPERRTFAYSLAVPAVLILQSLFSLSVVAFYYVHHPVGFVLLFLPWSIHIVVIVLAYQAIQRVGLHPPPSSLLVAALVTFFYFSAIHAFTPFLYRASWL